MKRTLMAFTAIAALAGPLAAPVEALAQSGQESRPAQRGGRGHDNDGARSARPERPAASRPDRPRPQQQRPERPSAEAPRPSRPEGQARPDRPHRPDRPGASNGGSRPDRPAGSNGQTRPNRPDRPNGGARPDRPGSGQDRPDRPSRPEGGWNRPDRPNGQARPDRPGNWNRPGQERPSGGWNRPDRPSGQNRPDRPGRPGGGWNPDRDRDHGEFRRRFNRDQWRQSFYRTHRSDWWRSDRRFRGYTGLRVGFYFAPGYGYYSVPRGYWGRHWSVGDYLPDVFWRYQLNDWRTFGLGYPPAGTRWVLVDNTIYLIDEYDGYIIEVIRDAWNW